MALSPYVVLSPLPAIDTTWWVYKCRPTPVRYGTLPTGTLAQGLSIDLAETFPELHCGPKLFLLNPPLSLRPPALWVEAPPTFSGSLSL